MITITGFTGWLFRRIWLAALMMPAAGYAQHVPPLNFHIFDSAANQGYFFLVPYTNTPPYIYDHNQLILDHLGNTVFYRTFREGPTPNQTIDFKLQPNGMISYFSTVRGKFYLMDSTFTVIDSIWCVNGYPTDQHDMQILSNGHYLLFGTETRIMNLSSYHWFGLNHTQPGSANAEVNGVVIQEFDGNKDLVWEWKAHDHYQFGDVSQQWLQNPNKVDWTHANAVERDYDGHILLSLRHFNEITKIDHNTGNIIWRLGGKQNQFTFPNDSLRFTGQHDIRSIGYNLVSLFDNGQYTTPRVARGVEYLLDIPSKTATLVWEYIHDNGMYSMACGNFQHIPNGNRLIDFGFTNGIFPWMAVVKPDQSKVLELSYPVGYISYRAFNYPDLPWQLPRPAVECRREGSTYFLVAEPGHASYQWSTGDTADRIIISDTGEYWVFVPYGTGWLSSEHILITDPLLPCIPVGIKAADEAASQDLRLMPNPAREKSILHFRVYAPGHTVISVFSPVGKEWISSDLGKLDAGLHEVPLELSDFPPGVYLVSLLSGNEKRVLKLVVR